MFHFKRILPLLGLALAATAVGARADIYVVDTTTDSNASACTVAPNDCSLRGAIDRANARAGADIISFADNAGDINLGAALPAITDGAGLDILAAPDQSVAIRRASGTLRLFTVSRNGALTLQRLGLNNGNAADEGGAVSNAGILVVVRCGFYNNRASGGGAISNFGGTLTVRNSFFGVNSASGQGGAILNRNDGAKIGSVTLSDTVIEFNDAANDGALSNAGEMTVRRCLLNNNVASADGGGIGNTGNLTVETATLFANNAGRNGGGIANAGAMTVRSCTIARNKAASGGGVANAGADVRVGNTILSQNTGTNFVNLAGTAGNLTSERYNISSDSSGPAQFPDRLNSDARLPSTLTYDDNSMGYLEPQSGSLAIDGGLTVASPDVRGQARPFDKPSIPNTSDGNGADVGAVEVGNEPPFIREETFVVRVGRAVNIRLDTLDLDGGPLTFTRNNNAPLPPGLSLSPDGFISGTVSNSAPADYAFQVRVTDNAGASSVGLIVVRVSEAPSLVVNTMGIDDPNDGKTTLREAVAFARTDGSATPVTFDANLFAAPRKTIALAGGKIDLFDGELVTIQGPPAGVGVRGDGTFELFFVGANGGLAVRGLTLSGGRSTRGGGILSFGNLSVDGCSFVGNRASGEGGAIYAEFIFGGKRASIVNSTFSDNSAGGDGGAIYNASYGIELDSLTIVGNSAQPNGGGGLGARSGSGQATRVTNCIIVGNTAGGLPNDVQTADFGPASFQSGGFNRIGVGNATGGFNASGDSVGNDATGIAPLAENGGPTPTRALLEGSAAIDKGQTNLKFDQRGIGRPQGAADQGAFEVVQLSVNVTLSPAAPRTTDTLTATAKASGIGNGEFAYSYEWQKNGATIPNETQNTLNLLKTGNGDKGDVIRVLVTARRADGTAGVGVREATVINSAPVAVSSQGVVDVDTEKGFPLLAFDADGAGDKLTFERVGGPRNGVKAEIRVDTDGVTKLFYRSRPRYGGVDIIRFVARDSDGRLSNESTLGITVNYTAPPPVNRAPIAGDTNIDTFVNTSVVKGLLGSDPDGDPITFRIVNNAKFGKSEIKQDTDGLFKLFYTSLNRFYGPDQVTYIAVDRYGKESNIATVRINFINRSPVAKGNRIGVASGEPVSQYLFADDPDNDTVTFRLVNNPRYGKGEVKRDEQGAWRFYYQSLSGYVGPDQITFIAIDPMGRESSVAAIEINVIRIGGLGALQSGATSGGGS